MAKIKKEILVAIKIIGAQFNEGEVYSGKEIKEKINEFYPGTIEFKPQDKKPSRPYKRKYVGSGGVEYEQ